VEVKSTRLFFTGSGGDRLAAQLDTPDGREPHVYCLFAHCFTCSRNYKAVVNVSRAMAARGFGILRFDFTGLGDSEGDFSDTNFNSNVEDLVAAADFMSKEFRSPKVLIGHSWGGTAVLHAARQINSAVAVATIAAPFDPTHVERAIGDKKDQILKQGFATVSIAGRSFRIKKQFLHDLTDGDFAARISGLNKPLIIFHSPADTVVNIENAAEIFKAARHHKSFVSLDRADHLLSDERDSRYVGAMIAEWSAKYV
jgi:putative redox protein